uniref:NADH-ubiquinone oxidoreductase chain 5 n=1 Tax=Gehyra marginata TaxID=1074251 RepID=A0A7R7J3B0_9SAUR|nr:NADH dehydrogenase subunit 5 [Gehyra marginata]
MTHLMFHTTMATTILTLLLPLIIPKYTTINYITLAVKHATMMSLVPLITLMNTGLETITLHFTWVNLNNLQISFMFDLYSTTFLPVALFISWSILEFTKWYLPTDPHLNKFSKYLLLFLTAMVTLLTANNMLQLFVGWEGVGIMSFLLIGWWHARPNANTSAMQAIIYNRIGDIGLIMSMAWLAMNLNSWDITNTLHPIPTLPLLGLILAATGKSAQFGLHPWLPAAMEGPTPVSALLHSSTMVVAGVFLLIRLHPMMQTNQTALSACLCLGAMTTTFAAFCAITQNDIKKIIAFSTSSQLGLMMLTIGMNQPKLAFLHITTHAFFKAMLFLCSGSIIHNLNNEQDIRKMGGLQHSLPTTTTCITLGSLALMGFPFLAGFYTKDTIIETATTSPVNAWALTITMAATALTAAYSLRLVFYSQLATPRYTPMTKPNENSPHQTLPISRLAVGTIAMGLLMTSTTLPEAPQTMTMPTLAKLSATLVTLMGLLIAMDLVTLTTKLATPKTSPTHTMLSHLMFFNTLAHRRAPNKNMMVAQKFSLQLNDLAWYEASGPMAMKFSHTNLSTTITYAYTGLIKTHLSAFMPLLPTCFMILTYGMR